MSAGVERIDDTRATPAVRGFLHRPAQPSPSHDAVVLTHGAGSDCNAPLLIALAEAFADVGWVVLRCDLPYRQARPHGPPRGSGAEDREGLRRAVEVLREHTGGCIFLGGASYGGRQATMLAAEDQKVCAGLLVLSYPLHPPGKPEQLRTKHLPLIRVPALFVSGAKDPFGSPAEIEKALKLIPVPAAFLMIEGAGHDLGFGRRARSKNSAPGNNDDLPRRIVTAFRGIVE
ncbi:MAG: dienelactone hydrolase family protein [Acidobacteriota bacterium]|nr:dienelactone hydrolase family protein [Acidobacteriota bacterium]